MTVREELDELGRKITADAKQGALKNKKTGALDKSFSYEYSFINDNQFSLVINQKYYGKYLNNKTHYMDKAIENNISKGISSIVEVLADEFLNEITNKLNK